MLNLDTHVLVHALVGELTRTEEALLRDDSWSISAIVLWEIAKLAELGRIEVDLDDAELGRTLARIHVWPLTLDVCRAIRRLDVHSDPAKGTEDRSDEGGATSSGPRRHRRPDAVSV